MIPYKEAGVKVGGLYIPNPDLFYVIGTIWRDGNCIKVRMKGFVLTLEIEEFDVRYQQRMTVFSYELGQKVTCFVSDFVEFNTGVNVVT